jgi:hypothetical protein
MNYEQKYLKYKIKYLNLKNQMGGQSDEYRAREAKLAADRVEALRVKPARIAAFELLKISPKCGYGTSENCKEVFVKFNRCIFKEVEYINSYVIPTDLSNVIEQLNYLQRAMKVEKIDLVNIDNLILAKASTPLDYQTNLELYEKIGTQITTKYY